MALPAVLRSLKRRARLSTAFFGLLLCVAPQAGGCGYAPLRGAGAPPTTIFVAPVRAEGASLEGAPAAETAVADAIARSPSFALADTGADLSVEIRIVRASSRLAPLSEPAVRAAHYQAIVVWACEARGPDGERLWGGNVTGTASYLSTPGAIETLDGARRRSIAQASWIAGERLIRRLAHPQRP